MRQIRIALRVPSAYGEVDFDDLEDAKYAIEACASRALLELLGSVIVEDVHISGDDIEGSEDSAGRASAP